MLPGHLLQDAPSHRRATLSPGPAHMVSRVDGVQIQGTQRCLGLEGRPNSSQGDMASPLASGMLGARPGLLQKVRACCHSWFSSCHSFWYSRLYSPGVLPANDALSFVDPS